MEHSKNKQRKHKGNRTPAHKHTQERMLRSSFTYHAIAENAGDPSIRTRQSTNHNLC